VSACSNHIGFKLAEPRLLDADVVATDHLAPLFPAIAHDFRKLLDRMPPISSGLNMRF
jgi:hypothetical protein